MTLAVASALFIVLALTQKGLAYPYDVAMASTPDAARAEVLEHPASARAHIALLDRIKPNLALRKQADEMAIAVWLDPTNPWIRDLYARILAQAGLLDEALREMTVSVAASPVLATHFYLDSRLIPWLAPAEQVAIRQGLEDAIASHYAEAVNTLGCFDDALGDFSDESRVYLAASVTTDRVERAQYLVRAARAETKKK